MHSKMLNASIAAFRAALCVFLHGEIHHLNFETQRGTIICSGELPQHT
jgi:hypothetical protein